ncbi:hypothetical protein [Aurantimonas endophytica]|uniref:Uncharacterized protein n=1 Tax=Aurantimonas endophytica TaxID=1522175 RepID=A0A7W6HFH9_9HYPH|nr:hypothetical protein [Aurantimonas endophytica]MBB4004269.1 hypothetical protein [Aurantimonas endophytica]MCO6405109.1 hypothetical protein [Aurantimonas endophytica]
MFKTIFKRVPYFESLRAFLEQWGIWKFLTGAAGLAAALLMSAWAWLESQLPYWAIASVFITTFVVMLAGTNYIYAILLKRRQVKMMDRIVHIDREQLADELQETSQKIAALVGEFLGPMQEAWWREADRSNPAVMQSGRARIEGQLVEKYSYRHGADVWRLIRRASKVVPIDQGDMWQIQHGVRGDHDLVNIYMFLAALSDDIRTPKTPLPQTDRRREEIARSQSSSLQLPQAPNF